jgi:hypothetical protein
MAKTKKELLDDYDKKLIEWCLENKTMTTYHETRGLSLKELLDYNASHPRKSSWPLTEEEDADRTALYKELSEAAEEVDDEPQHLLFFTSGNGQTVKFVK